jgi:SPP1 gp7 family putative phage head morphogenesis protein
MSMKPQVWRVAKQTEQAYLRDILAMLRKVYADITDPTVSVIGASEFIERYAWQAAQRMVTGVLYGSARTWREAARKAMRGQEIYELLNQELQGPIGERVRELIRENAQLIRSLPQDIAQQVAQEIATATVEGRRPESITSLVPYVAKWKAQLIARTETSKATTALTQARSESLDVIWYVWQSSQDERVRLSHRKMQGVLVQWDDPPSPEQLAGERSYGHYQAGNIFNCRCYPEPLLRFDQVSWPHRCYMNGRIQHMTLAQFKRVNFRPAIAA